MTQPLEDLQATAQLVLSSPTPSNRTVMRRTADTLLNRSDLLESLTPKDRWRLVQILFPFFTLPPGWRAVAEAGGLTPPQIAQLIARRVTAIKSREDAQREAPFIRELVRQAANERLAYKLPLAPFLTQIIDVLRTHAPELLAEAKDRIQSWRLAAQRWLHRHKGTKRW